MNVPSNPKNLVKIGPADSEIFWGKCQFLPIVPKLKFVALQCLGLVDNEILTQCRAIIDAVHPYGDIPIRLAIPLRQIKIVK